MYKNAITGMGETDDIKKYGLTWYDVIIILCKSFLKKGEVYEYTCDWKWV